MSSRVPFLRGLECRLVRLVLLAAVPLALFFFSHQPAGASARLSERLEARTAALVNAVRRRSGLASLPTSADLAAAARRHAFEMVRLGFFGHESADGRSFHDRVARIQGCRNWSVGENLFFAPTAGASAVVNAWLSSPSHRDILLGAWGRVGVAAVTASGAPGVFGGGRVVVVAAEFGRCF